MAGVYYHRIITHLVNNFHFHTLGTGYFQTFIFTQTICFLLDYLAETPYNKELGPKVFRLLYIKTQRRLARLPGTKTADGQYNKSFAKLETDRRVQIALDSESKHY